MAESESKGGGSIPWVNLTALLMAVAGGISLLVQPLVSSRPQKGSRPVETIAEQDVDARLWQDPLSVAIEHFEKAATADKSNVLGRTGEHLARLKDEVGKLRATSTEQQRLLLILPVMIPEGPYAENNERRLRTRQAVISGLAVSGFTPKDGERIGYFLLPQPDLSNSVAESPSLLSARVVPYEWFGPRYDDPSLAKPEGIKHILILWVRDDLPGATPLNTLSKLGEALEWDASKQNISVIGPGTSTSLTSLLNEDSEMTQMEVRLSGIGIYAPMPTAASSIMALSTNVRTISSITKLKSGRHCIVPSIRTTRWQRQSSMS